MNLFVLDRMPDKAAQYNCDSHVRKIILEATEMMGCAYDDGDFAPWPWVSKSKFVNHPMSYWVRENRHNFSWTLEHAYALCSEFEYRFGKPHKCFQYLDWISHNIPINNLSDDKQSDWPRCFGYWKEDIEITNDAIQDYRKYYRLAKRHLMIYTKRNLPEWYY
jgi:hypothetical protein